MDEIGLSISSNYKKISLLDNYNKSNNGINKTIVRKIRRENLYFLFKRILKINYREVGVK